MLVRRALHFFVRWQAHLCAQFDRILPAEYRIDGNREFVDVVVPPFITPGLVIYDIGAGKRPLIEPQIKQRLGLTVVGVDVDGGELGAAPPNAYDRAECADVRRYSGRGDADIVLCQALLEHVFPVHAAVESIARVLKPGGFALIFVPSRNAVFARVNLLLPEALKRFLLRELFPSSRGKQGFPAFYDRCTPRDLKEVAEESGLEVRACKVYFRSSYFSFFFPLHGLWRAWQVVFRAVAGDQAAETFTLILQRADRRTE